MCDNSTASFLHTTNRYQLFLQALGNMLRFFAKSVPRAEEPENAAIQTQPSTTPAVDWRGVSDIWYIVGKNVGLIQSTFLVE
jgi:hypothetical protein